MDMRGGDSTPIDGRIGDPIGRLECCKLKRLGIFDIQMCGVEVWVTIRDEIRQGRL